MILAEKVKGHLMLLCHGTLNGSLGEKCQSCVRVQTGYFMWWYSVMRGKNNRGTDCKQRQVPS